MAEMALELPVIAFGWLVNSLPALQGSSLFAVLEITTTVGFYCACLAIYKLLKVYRDKMFRKIAVLAIFFFFSCGTSRVTAVLEGGGAVWRAVNAVVIVSRGALSLSIAVALISLLPKVEKLPSRAELEEEIEERRKAQDLLAASNERFHDFIESFRDYAIYQLDLDGIVRSWNTGGERIKGYRSAEIVGQPYARFFREEDQQAGLPSRILETVRREGKYEGEGWRIKKDGTRFWAHAVVRSIDGPDGHPVGFAKITRDLTETRELEARYRTLLEATPDSIVIVNDEGRVVYVNSQTEKLFGYRAEELVGRQVDDLVPPDTRETQALYVDTLLDDARDQSVQKPRDPRGLRKDGTSFPLEFSVSPLETREGRLLLFSVRDLTEWRRTEARFKVLLESAADAILIIEPGGRIQFANGQVEILYGYARRELIGESVELLTPERCRAEYRSLGREYNRAPSLRVVPNPTEVAAGIDFLGRRKDGTEFSLEMSVSPIDMGSENLILLSIRDITERKQAEVRFRNLLESAPDAMVIYDRQGLVQLANAQTERLFGYAVAELLGSSVNDLVPEILQTTESICHGPRMTGPVAREADVNLLGRRRDGTEFPVEISVSPLESAGAITVTAVIRDVTDRKLAEKAMAQKVEELRHSNEALGQFAHFASHDLQEPLRMVASYTQLLAKRYKGRLDSDADEFIEFAVDGTRRMKRMIDDLLLYSRAGQKAFKLHDCRMDDLVEEAISNLQAAIAESGAVVTHEQLPTVAGVHSQMVVVLQNLIGNAIKYRSKEAPRVHISAKERDGEWEFLVSDNGMGIDPAFFERIFLLFQRLHGGEFEGTGIGLAICKQTISQLGGRIWVASGTAGSTFHFALPRSANP